MHAPHTFWTVFQHAIRALCLVLVAAAMQGCPEYQLRMANSDPVNEQYQTGTIHSILWGNWYNPSVLEATCASQAINDVKVKGNYFYSLVSVITLGIWMPTEVDYRCKAPAGDTGSFPEAPAESN